VRGGGTGVKAAESHGLTLALQSHSCP